MAFAVISALSSKVLRISPSEDRLSDGEIAVPVLGGHELEKFACPRLIAIDQSFISKILTSQYGSGNPGAFDPVVYRDIAPLMLTEGASAANLNAQSSTLDVVGLDVFPSGLGVESVAGSLSFVQKLTGEIVRESGSGELFGYTISPGAYSAVLILDPASELQWYSGTYSNFVDVGGDVYALPPGGKVVTSNIKISDLISGASEETYVSEIYIGYASNEVEYLHVYNSSAATETNLDSAPGAEININSWHTASDSVLLANKKYIKLMFENKSSTKRVIFPPILVFFRIGMSASEANKSG